MHTKRGFLLSILVLALSFAAGVICLWLHEIELAGVLFAVFAVFASALAISEAVIVGRVPQS